MKLTIEEQKELKLLRALQADHTRWLSQEEFDRINELITKRGNNHAGRKPVKNKDSLKEQVYIYVEKAKIKKIGGLEVTREYLLFCVENYKKLVEKVS